MRPYVLRPARDPLLQPLAIVGEEGSSRFFVAGQITRNREHELVGSLLSGASFLLWNTAASSLIYQSPEHCGCTARLCS
jgi:hypothetical protein